MPTVRSLVDYLFNPKRAVVTLLDRRKHGWVGDAPVRMRRYSSYSDYVEHQKKKLDVNPSEWLQAHEREYPEILSARIRDLGVTRPGMTVLCLAARLGGEVRAFIGLGCFAVGIDLNPGGANRYVLTGDFHEIQFAAQSVDIVFCNALDHAFDIPRMMSECRRVLKPQGRLLLELVNGDREGYTPGHFEATIWRTIPDVLSLVCQNGFSIVERREISQPWQGEIVCLTPSGNVI